MGESRNKAGPSPDDERHLREAGFNSPDEMYVFLTDRGRRHLRSGVQDWSTAEDLAHNGAIEFWLALGERFHPTPGNEQERRQGAFVYYAGILNKLEKKWRSRGYFERTAQQGIAVAEAGVAPSPLEDLVTADSPATRKMVEAAIARVENPDYRDILIRRLLKQQPYNIIAEETGKPMGTLHAQCFRALEELRDMLRHMFPDLLD